MRMHGTVQVEYSTGAVPGSRRIYSSCRRPAPLSGRRSKDKQGKGKPGVRAYTVLLTLRHYA